MQCYLQCLPSGLYYGGLKTRSWLLHLFVCSDVLIHYVDIHPFLESIHLLSSVNSNLKYLYSIMPTETEVPIEAIQTTMAEQDPAITQEFKMDGTDLPPLEAPPASPRESRTKQLLAQFPGLTIPEAMRAACYTIEESENGSLLSIFEAELAALKAKQIKEKKTRLPPGSQQPHPTKKSAPLMNLIDPSELPEGIVLCSVRPKNAAGRCLCRVENCRKLDQANNDGFCRAHYNLIKGRNDDPGAENGEPWTCDSCSAIVSFHQKRCGNCHRWKDGQRASLSPRKAAQALTGETWTCDCGNEVPEPKSRCGKCHHWKGGKRTGGWKLGAKIENVPQVVDDIDRTQDWECCGEVIAAAKTRCGKCRKWRGGKRQIRWSYAGSTEAGNALIENDDDLIAVDPDVEWTCKTEACKTVNKGTKKRCSACFSWRFSRKKARASTDAVHTGENSGISMDQLDALVTEEIQKHESTDGAEAAAHEPVAEAHHTTVEEGSGEQPDVNIESV